MEKLHESFEDYINENSSNQELESIRHFKGSVEDLVNFFQSRSEGGDVNNGEPTRQGYKVHPTREETQSPHWDEITESIVGYNQIGSDERYLVYNIKGLVDLGRKVKINLVSIMDEDTYFPCIVNLTKKKPLFRNLNNNEIENLKKGKFFEKEETQSPHWSEVNEAAKIACVECDEVNTKAAWKKNGGFCPSCKSSSQGVLEGEFNTKKFKDLEIGDNFLRFGKNGQLWKKISNKQAEFIKNVGKKTAPYNKKSGSLNIFPQTMDVTFKDDTVNEFGPMMGSGNRRSEPKELVSEIGELDDILMYTKNRRAEMEWEMYTDDVFDDERSYWADLEDYELVDAIEKARSIIKKYKVKERKI